MITVPNDLSNKQTYKRNKQRFHLVEYTNAVECEHNEVLLTESAIVYVKQGRKVVIINGEQRRIEAGSLFMATKGDYVMSEYTPENGVFESIMIFFNSEHIREITATITIVNTMFADSQSCFHIIESNQELQEFYRSINQIVSNKSGFYVKELVELKIRELIYLLLSNPASRLQTAEFLQKGSENHLVNVSQVIERNIYKSVDVTSLATMCNMSSSTFKREFKRRYADSPMKWITERRLERALQLIETTEKSVADIAYECGFENYIHFARRFRSKYGESATARRAKLQCE